MFRAHLVPIGAALIPRLFLIFFRFMQPLLIRQISSFVAAPVAASTTNNGWGLAAASGLIYTGLALSTAIYYHQVYRTVTMVRGSLVAAVYEQTTLLPTLGLDESAALTLMSTDVQKICDALKQGHELWASLIEISLGIWLLSREIGIALIGPLAVTVFAVAATMSMSKSMSAATGTWMVAVQDRIDVTANTLGAMKEIKLLGLSDVASKLLRSLRIREIAKSLRSRRLMAASLAMANVSTALGPAAALGIYVTASKSSDLDAPRAFAALSLIFLVTAPVKAVIYAYGPTAEALACVHRIEQYLSLQQHKDQRLLKNRRTDATVVAREGSIELRSMTSHSLGHERIELKVENVAFGWSGEAPLTVQPLTFQIFRSSFTFLVGPVGSGKSTLLKGLLGELQPRSGRIQTSLDQAAFVSQTPWLQHKSIRDNILGDSLFDRGWYDQVVHACALHHDISNFSQNDNTTVGPSGSSLSGGQKLRVVSFKPRSLLCYITWPLELTIMNRHLLVRCILGRLS